MSNQLTQQEYETFLVLRDIAIWTLEPFHQMARQTTYPIVIAEWLAKSQDYSLENIQATVTRVYAEQFAQYGWGLKESHFAQFANALYAALPPITR